MTFQKKDTNDTQEIIYEYENKKKTTNDIYHFYLSVHVSALWYVYVCTNVVYKCEWILTIKIHNFSELYIYLCLYIYY